MSMKDFLAKDLTKKIIAVVLLLAVALLSIFVISKPATNPETYSKTIQSIDSKKATVMSLTASAAAASTALAAIPGDVTTPIANQVMEISAYLLIVVCILVLEKSLLTVMGYLAFTILVPVACVLFGIFIFTKKDMLKNLAIKFLVFALVIVMIIPFSLKISDLIYDANKSTVEQVTQAASQSIEDEQAQEDKNWLESTLDSIKDGISAAGETAKKVLNSFIDAIAMFIITYCAIPIIVVLVVIWFIKFLFGITVPVPKLPRVAPFKKKNEQQESTELQQV